MFNATKLLSKMSPNMLPIIIPGTKIPDGTLVPYVIQKRKNQMPEKAIYYSIFESIYAENNPLITPPCPSTKRRASGLKYSGASCYSFLHQLFKNAC